MISIIRIILIVMDWRDYVFQDYTNMGLPLFFRGAGAVGISFDVCIFIIAVFFAWHSGFSSTGFHRLLTGVILCLLPWILYFYFQRPEADMCYGIRYICDDGDSG